MLLQPDARSQREKKARGARLQLPQRQEQGLQLQRAVRKQQVSRLRMFGVQLSLGVASHCLPQTQMSHPSLQRGRAHDAKESLFGQTLRMSEGRQDERRSRAEEVA